MLLSKYFIPCHDHLFVRTVFNTIIPFVRYDIHAMFNIIQMHYVHVNTKYEDAQALNRYDGLVVLGTLFQVSGSSCLIHLIHWKDSFEKYFLQFNSIYSVKHILFWHLTRSLRACSKRAEGKYILSEFYSSKNIFLSRCPYSTKLLSIDGQDFDDYWFKIFVDLCFKKFNL